MLKRLVKSMSKDVELRTRTGSTGTRMGLGARPIRAEPISNIMAAIPMATCGYTHQVLMRLLSFGWQKPEQIFERCTSYL